MSIVPPPGAINSQDKSWFWRLIRSVRDLTREEDKGRGRFAEGVEQVNSCTIHVRVNRACTAFLWVSKDYVESEADFLAFSGVRTLNPLCRKLSFTPSLGIYPCSDVILPHTRMFICRPDSVISCPRKSELLSERFAIGHWSTDHHCFLCLTWFANSIPCIKPFATFSIFRVHGLPIKFAT
jgi:hypothetical protein